MKKKTIVKTLTPTTKLPAGKTLGLKQLKNPRKLLFDPVSSKPGGSTPKSKLNIVKPSPSLPKAK